MSDKIPLIPNTVYHIYNHANGNENLFRKEENYIYFLDRYRRYIQPIAKTFAYCLMPNHFHFLIRISSEEELRNFLIKKKGLSNEDLQGLKDFGGLEELIRKLPSQQFSNLFNGYSKAINKAFNRTGSLFQPNLKRKTVEDEHYFTTLIRYIHLNPVLHNFVDDANRWRFSSLSAYNSEKPSYLDRKTVFDWFGGKQLFQEYHKNILKEEIERIQEFTFGLL